MNKTDLEQTYEQFLSLADKAVAFHYAKGFKMNTIVIRLGRKIIEATVSNRIPKTKYDVREEMIYVSVFDIFHNKDFIIDFLNNLGNLHISLRSLPNYQYDINSIINRNRISHKNTATRILDLILKYFDPSDLRYNVPYYDDVCCEEKGEQEKIADIAIRDDLYLSISKNTHGELSELDKLLRKLKDHYEQKTAS